MANVRPPRKSKFTRVDNENEEPEFINPVRGRRTEDFSFTEDYAQMHSNSFNKEPSDQTEGLGQNKIKNVTGAHLESLVKTLASLQFTVKGKIDVDGNAEIVFCSPEPIVVEERPKAEVKFMELPQRKEPHRKHRHREPRRRFLM